jgi:hypothetical protein
MKSSSTVALGILVMWSMLVPKVSAQGKYAFEGAPFFYSNTQPIDAATILNTAIHGREAEVRAWPARQRLQWLLKSLGIPEASQILVFSRTSLQRKMITPENPRALYYSDNAYVGWVPGGMMEVTVFDPVLGATFYAFDPDDTGVLLQRSGDCLSCHVTHDETPTLRARSIFPDAHGDPLGGSSISNIDCATPLSRRWGGWYVTGGATSLRHRGNITGKSADDFGRVPRGTVLAALPAEAHPDNYLQPTSDIVALLVHDHQVHVHNVLLAASQQSRLALHRWPIMREVLHLPANAPPSGSCLTVLESQASKVIDALLFREEAAYPETGIHGHGPFELAYREGRKVDTLGHSLRDLDLKTRLYRYRCSPLVYAESFSSMPLELKVLVLQKLSEGLSATEPPEAFQHLANDERATIRQILIQTLPGFPK